MYWDVHECCYKLCQTVVPAVSMRKINWKKWNNSQIKTNSHRVT